MIKNTLSICFVSLFIIVSISLVFVGCGSKESLEIYPPIVFNPVPGQLQGGPIADNLVVTVVGKSSGKPIAGAEVFVHQGEPYELKSKVETNEQGIADFSGQGINGQVTITATCNKSIAYDTVSFVNVNASQMTIPMDPRKDPDKVKTALTFIGLDSGDESMTLSRNDVPYKAKQIKSGKLVEDPLMLKVPSEPMAFSAQAVDAAGNTSKFGFTVEPDGPLPQSTPAMINLVRINQDNVKICDGAIENPPANLDRPKDGWDPYKRYIFQVYSDAGIAGDVVAGFANITEAFSYQAFIVNTPGLDNMRLEVSALNRNDSWSEMTTAITHFKFMNAPAKGDFNFIDAPKNLQIGKVEGQAFPDLLWIAGEGNLAEVEIYHADYNYHWTLYVPGENLKKVVLPPLEPGSPGAMLADEIYRFRVTNWLVPGLDFNTTSFQAIKEAATHKSRSSLTKFMVKALETDE